MTRLMRRVRSERDCDGDGGFTLLELLVSAMIFSIFIAIFATATTTMLADVRKEQGNANELDANRKVLALLDRQARYANAINTPGIGTDSNPYVEWREGDIGAQQTCYQWRLNVSARQLQYRTWQPPVPPATTPAATATAWSTQAVTIDPPSGGTSAVFVLAPGGALISGRQQLSVTFIDKQGNPYSRTATQVSLTGQNTTSTTPPSGVCTEIGRP
ncbi:MAG: prepilin-type N-terminal cleavage/methylation domain-containing protein [Actinomycetota bacterium]|nr:prepilin-type N-terminal cleavage/methylation domain-containing protein [Actinomycetota bacterium]